MAHSTHRPSSHRPPSIMTAAMSLTSLALFAAVMVSSTTSPQTNNNNLMLSFASAFEVDDNNEDVMGDDDVMPEGDLDYEEENTKKNSNNIASAVSGLNDLFTAAAAASCENELIPPEESCCHAPSSAAAAAPLGQQSKKAAAATSSAFSSSISGGKKMGGAFGDIMGMGGGAQDTHECFAPPIHDEDHPWDSSPALKEAMRSAATELTVDDFEKLVFGENGGAAHHPSFTTQQAQLLGNNNAGNKNVIAAAPAATAAELQQNKNNNKKGTSYASSSASSSSIAAHNKNKVLVIDTRCAAEFVAGHVPTAVFGGLGTDQFDRFIGTVHSDHNVPVVFIHTPPPAIASSASENKHIAAAAAGVNGADKNTVDEDNSKKVIEEIAQRLVKAGLSNLKGHLKGGMAAWLEAKKPITITQRWSAATLVDKLLVDEKHIVTKNNNNNNQKKVDSKKQQDEASAAAAGIGAPPPHHPQSLVDLREPCASDYSSLPNSESIPVSETVLQEVFYRALLEKNESHPLVLFCSNGFRSLMVASALKAVKPDINLVCMDSGFDELETMGEIKQIMG